MKFEPIGPELKPLRDRIASLVRDSVIEGKLKPGGRVTEDEIAGSLGVSRTPIREAFLQLEQEGFLTVHPRKGAVVTELSLQDAQETYLIKGALEALAGRLAMDYAEEEEIEHLEALNRQMEKIARSESKNYRRFLDLNSRFHHNLCELSKNQKLIKIITTLRKQTLRYNYIYVSLLSHLQQSVDEHWLIIRYIKEKNGEKLEQLIRVHGETARLALYDFIQKNQQPVTKN
ncbi:MAG: GntR family transcriptional regulator [Ignavibacteriales bacterium]|nr:HTH-type transcriptional repressor RspR [Ignavibacteriaceae bacterium]MCK6615232.1 GntR family transcriptional regulator [Ignavibacteriaceae bacterium]QOJ30388.1 MAG: GntR family transcriptional regulator [Ignavibacteriales bacterium]